MFLTDVLLYDLLLYSSKLPQHSPPFYFLLPQTKLKENKLFIVIVLCFSGSEITPSKGNYDQLSSLQNVLQELSDLRCCDF